MKTNINNWEWEIEDPGFLEYWFSDWESLKDNNPVKSNPEREVFIIEVQGRKYYVKYSHPTSLLQKTRAKIIPKAASEFNAAKLLENSGIATARVIGWAKKGSESMLVTEAITGAADARKYWFSIDYHDFERRKVFLNSMTNFLRVFLAAGFYHPDFHLGNLLVTENNNKIKLTLIDPYGLTDVNSLSGKKSFEMLCIIGALRGEINDETGKDLVKVINPELSEEEAAETWQKIIIAESMKTIKLWEKRQDRILSDPRYSQILNEDNMKVRIRKDLAGNPVIHLQSTDEISQYENEYDLKKMTPEEAEKAWLFSFKAEFHRIPEERPIAWITRENQPECLLYEKEKKTVLSQEEIEFRAKLAGLIT